MAITKCILSVDDRGVPRDQYDSLYLRYCGAGCKATGLLLLPMVHLSIDFSPVLSDHKIAKPLL